MCFHVITWFCCLVGFYLAGFVHCQSSVTDAAVMQDLKKSINPPSSLGWNDPDPCKWVKVQCSRDNRVTRIQIGNEGLKGSLPSNLNNLTALQVFEVQGNELSRSLPSFAGLSMLQRLVLSDNNFTSIPPDFFDGMTSLQEVYLDQNPFASWVIPQSLQSTASALQSFSALSCNISGVIPDFLGTDGFAGLTTLRLSFNNLEGPLPASFSGSQIQTLWLNGQQSESRLNGSIAVVQNMTQLSTLWLHMNSFTGPIPDLSGLTQLKDLSLRDNRFTGVVPLSLTNLPMLLVVNLTNNFLQGPTPRFPDSIQADIAENTNSFCLPDPGKPCDSRVDALLSVEQDFQYPTVFSESWKGNNPCDLWMGVTCNNGNIIVINVQGIGLVGTISPNFSSIVSLRRLILANNGLTGTIPNELTLLPNLIELDVTNNQLHGKLPAFRSNVVVKTSGNVDIVNADAPGVPPNGAPTSGGSGGDWIFSSILPYKFWRVY